MEASFLQDGRTIDYTPVGADVEAGQVIDLGSGLIGVAGRKILDGELGALDIVSVFEFTKAAGAGVTFATGDVVGWDDTANTAVTAVDLNKTFDVGKAVAAAGDNDALVRAKLNI